MYKRVLVMERGQYLRDQMIVMYNGEIQGRQERSRILLYFLFCFIQRI